MSRTISFSKAINEGLHQEMEHDENVFILGEDVAKMGGDFGVTQGIWQKWPDRARDTALSESAIIGLACGASVCGLRPVAEIMFADFIGVCFDQIVNNVAKLRYMYNGKAGGQMVIRAITGGGIRCAYHHSQCVEAWLMNTPGLVIVAPATPYEAKGLLISSIRNNNPVIFLEHKLLYNSKGDVPEESYEIPLYEAEIVEEGEDVTIVAAMSMLPMARKVAEDLRSEDISCEIINPRTIFPLDRKTIIESVAKTGRLVIAQEGPRVLGYAAEVSAMISEDLFEYLEAPIRRVTSLDTPMPFAPNLEDFVLPKLEELRRAVVETVRY